MEMYDGKSVLSIIVGVRCMYTVHANLLVVQAIGSQASMIIEGSGGTIGDDTHACSSCLLARTKAVQHSRKSSCCLVLRLCADDNARFITYKSPKSSYWSQTAAPCT